MEPLRQGGTQRTLIWEEKDFSSKLWEMTPLFRVTYFLQVGQRSSGLLSVYLAGHLQELVLPRLLGEP